MDDVPGLEAAREADSVAGPADTRMARYLLGEHHPQEAMMPRVVLLAETTDSPVGYIGGHLTERYGCDGELQYLYVVPSHRRTGVASELLRVLVVWLQAHGASRVCVDAEPKNHAARSFCARHGAVPLNPHWMLWDDIGVV